MTKTKFTPKQVEAILESHSGFIEIMVCSSCCWKGSQNDCAADSTENIHCPICSGDVYPETIKKVKR